VAEQTREIQNRIDALLAEAGTDKTKLPSATVWLVERTTQKAAHSWTSLRAKIDAIHPGYGSLS
jgi:enamine deaminase RidA (YjgF/YER057c/UK114 family)